MHFPLKLLAIVTLAGVLLAGVTPAGADCTKSGIIVMVYYNHVSSSALCYLASGAYPTFNHTFHVANPTAEGAVVMDLLNAAMASGLRVQITGDATSCPSSGTYRQGGNIKSVKVYSVY